MGYYINPKHISKEQWLQENGTPQPSAPDFNTAVSNGQLPVCLVDNGVFTAAAVSFDPEEHTHFQHPQDTRRKQWFLVPRHKLIQVGALQE